MSLADRIAALVRTAAGTPAVRRLARDLVRAGVRTVQENRGGGGGAARSGARDGSPQRDDGSARSAGRPQQDSRGGHGTDAPLQDRTTARPVVITYAPREDDHPDPGEIVWAWVPYEEDITRGKDRPVLVIAQEDASVGGSDGSGEVLVALMLTSRDHARAGRVTTDEHGATWVDIGSGDWDRKGRPSEVRADRLLRLAPDGVRREGARLDRARFDRVAEAVAATHGWR